MKRSATIIGSGFAALSTACYLAKEGLPVEVFEKNADLGGRARQFTRDGFKFDMGPTWYWMPDVFERFFADFGKKPSDYYRLELLTPSYRVYFDEMDYLDVDASIERISAIFEREEPGSSAALRRFMQKAKRNYDLAIRQLVYKPGLSPWELVTKDTVREAKQFYFSIQDYVRKHFRNPRLRQILEFPVLFLGAKPGDTPLFYSFMNYADLGLGTWYPRGGMRSVVEGIVRLATELGVIFHTDAEVTSIQVDQSGFAQSITVNGQDRVVDILVSGADYKHSEELLAPAYRNYGESYWKRRTMAPSSLLFYVGFDTKLQHVLHHTLFFDASFDKHAIEIYDRPAWPRDPLFYASFPSITDLDVAPPGKETAIFLIPLAPDLPDSEETRERYFDIILRRLERLTRQRLRDQVLFKRSYCVQDFKDDYHSFRGNAYGLANTLRQTAFLRPSLKSKRVKNLYFTGQLTVPGPGVPPALISGKLVSNLVKKEKITPYESIV